MSTVDPGAQTVPLLIAHCICDDPEAHQVAALVAGGMGQWEACRLMWSPGPLDIVDHVRQQFAAAFPWLVLPPEAVAPVTAIRGCAADLIIIDELGGMTA